MTNERIDDQGLDLDSAAKQFAEPAFGRHDPDGGRLASAGNTGIRGGLCLRTVVDRAELHPGLRAGLQFRRPHEPVLLPEEGIYTLPVRSDHLDRQRLAGLENATPDAASERVPPAVE